MWDLNPRPSAYKADAITTMLIRRIFRASTRDRTGDLQIFSLTLSQLSYRGINELMFYIHIFLSILSIVRQPGIEPGPQVWET